MVYSFPYTKPRNYNADGLRKTLVLTQCFSKYTLCCWLETQRLPRSSH